ncbi:hypothetical protein HQ394_17355 [Defluviicoccus vanus]|uniref:Tetratricopeptide repeat protein n=1 Tax=Defluviicoccus vanus TaxID=111831 RepID=A0A7H1N4X5_9PROT|nr:hypothetical protein HQ394_17355 [Defluviicoccus vanus]
MPAAVDPALVQAQRLGRHAFDQDRPDQAAALYRQALDHAYRLDDLPAISDTGYNLAIVELSLSQSAAALDVARSTGDELGRRGAAVPADLQLVEAMALYRTGAAEAAANVATSVTRLPDTSPETVAAVIFLTGQVAGDRCDPAALALAGQATAARGETATAADLYLRAGRSAALAADTDKAKQWLTIARDLARRSEESTITSDAHSRLNRLGTAAPR